MPDQDSDRRAGADDGAMSEPARREDAGPAPLTRAPAGFAAGRREPDPLAPAARWPADEAGEAEDEERQSARAWLFGDPAPGAAQASPYAGQQGQSGGGWEPVSPGYGDLPGYREGSGPAGRPRRRHGRDEPAPADPAASAGQPAGAFSGGLPAYPAGPAYPSGPSYPPQPAYVGPEYPAEEYPEDPLYGGEPWYEEPSHGEDLPYTGTSLHAAQVQRPGAYPARDAGSGYPAGDAAGGYPADDAGSGYPAGDAAGGYPADDAAGYPADEDDQDWDEEDDQDWSAEMDTQGWAMAQPGPAPGLAPPAPGLAPPARGAVSPPAPAPPAPGPPAAPAQAGEPGVGRYPGSTAAGPRWWQSAAPAAPGTVPAQPGHAPGPEPADEGYGRRAHRHGVPDGHADPDEDGPQEYETDPRYRLRFPAGAAAPAAPAQPEEALVPLPGGDQLPGETADDLTVEALLPGKRQDPGTGWRRWLYRTSGGMLHPRESAEAVRRRELVERVRTPVAGGHHRVAVMSLKGGVGKTTTTVGLGAMLASLRGDRIIALDANPDRGTLSDKVRLETSATVRDLLNEREQVQRYADVRAFTSQAPSRLEVLASDRDPTVSVAFCEEDYYDAARVLEHYYSISLTDCGTGLLHSAMVGVLRMADQIILVSSPSVDGARSASATLDWLDAHDYGDLVRTAVVVLSMVRRRSKSTIDLDRLEHHFAGRCRAVVRIPYDGYLEEGAEVDLELMSPATVNAYLELAATVADGFAWPRQVLRQPT